MYRPGPTNIKADYQTKHFSPSNHQNMRPELLTPVQILNTLRTQQGKELPIFTDRERVCYNPGILDSDRYVTTTRLVPIRWEAKDKYRSVGAFSPVGFYLNCNLQPFAGCLP